MGISIEKQLHYDNSKVDVTTTWLLFLFLGWSYGSLGKIGLQILFYLTGGGLGIWAFIRLFTLASDIKDYNYKKAVAAGYTHKEMALAGIL